MTKASSGRRVVTGARPDGTSHIVACGTPTKAYRFRPPEGGVDSHSLTGRTAVDGFDPPTPGEVVTTELWATHPGEPPGGFDPVERGVGFDVETLPGATKWRLVVMGAGWQAPMHRTVTVDYDIVLAGQLELVLDEGSVMLGPGDMVMLPGVNHAWKAGPEGATLAVAMVGVAGIHDDPEEVRA
jgi:quercetin dioxygenase-like cupin family protein